MADRTVRVRLEMLAQGFQQALSGASRGVSQFATGTQSSARTAGSAMKGLGPIALGAGVAIGVGLMKGARALTDFEESAIRLQTQIGLTEEAAGELSGAARRIGRETGIGAQETVDASFQIASAGLRGEDAMEALELAAQGARIGLGDTRDVADLITSAMNAYGSEVLDAEQATDTLLAAVKEGKAEAPEFASALGQVLPIASEMGVSFGEIAGNVAAMTRTGTDPGTATIQLRQMLMGLINPSEQAKEALADVGLSAQGLRDQIREEGLYSALLTLKDAFGDNEEGMSQVFENARSLMGVLDLLGANAEENARIVEDVWKDSAGGMDEAIAQVEQTTSDRLARMNAEWQEFWLMVGGGGKPLLDVGISGMTTAARMAQSTVGPSQMTDTERFRDVTMDERTVENIRQLTRAYEEQLEVETDLARRRELHEKLAELKAQLDEIDAVRVAQEVEVLTAGWQSGEKAAPGYLEAINAVGHEFVATADATGRGAEWMEKYGTSAEKTAAKVEALTNIIDAYLTVGMNAERANIRLEEGWTALEEQLEESTKVYDDAGEVVDTVSASLDINTEKGRANRSAILDQADAILGAVSAEAERSDSLIEAGRLYEDQVGKLRDVMTQAGFTEAEIDDYIETLGLTPEQVVTAIIADDQASGVLADVARIIGGIPRFTHTTVTVGVNADAYNRAMGRIQTNTPIHTGGVIGADGSVKRYHAGGMVGGGRGLKSDEVPAILQTRERVLSRAQNEAFEQLVRLLGRSTVTAGPMFHAGGVVAGGDGAAQGGATFQAVLNGVGMDQVQDAVRRGLRDAEFQARTSGR